ncbi:uncharacterized protein LOC141649699 [Silene latifolia]|uniref:uncharacterized protein LOC141649699 n=1 Tax=Silene latifolia TaxID=37657 RepID=UPI003D773C91
MTVYGKGSYMEVGMGHEYTIAKGYDWLRDKGEKVQWSKYIWNKWIVPKHAMLVWIYQHQSLNTNAKLKSLGIVDNDACLVCGDAIKTLEHLFLNCAYSRLVISALECWLNLHLPTQNLIDWRWRRKGSKMKQGFLNAVLNATIYQIWRQRNLSRFEGKLVRPKRVAQNIVIEMKIRVTGIANRSMDARDRVWCRDLQIEI